MKYVLGTSPVEDFEHWQSTFHDNESYRADHGERGYHVFRSQDEPNDVTVLFEWDENEDPSGFFASNEMREIMTEAGLTGIPEITVLESVEHKTAQQSSA